jgi:hypothetical protein
MNLKLLQPILFLGIGLLFLAGCFKNESTIKNTDQDLWAKRAWMEKAARALRYGDGLTPTEDIDTLLAKPKDQIIDHFMKDTRFVDTVLDFNLFFLGLKTGAHFYQNRPGSREYLAANISPQSLTSARAVWEGKDYFSLFNLTQPFYFQGQFDTINPSDNPAQIPEVEFRKKELERALAKQDSLVEFTRQAKARNMDKAGFCENSSKILEEITKSLDKSGLPFQTRDNFQGLKGITFELTLTCFISDYGVNFDKILEQLANYKERLGKLTGILQYPGLTNPPVVRSPMDVLTLNDGDFGIENPEDLFTVATWNVLQNSSTNFNRKRAAYVLKTYFCDDLTPINIALPSEHVNNKHATDPSCATCHYKMDPMAGFFRHYGILGSNFENDNLMIFDDASIIRNEAYTKYMSSWLAPAGSGRKWDVGYIRSAKDPSKNTYGDSLKDLAQIIRSSNEVKQCLTKRMAEFFLGKDQVYDTEWVNSLAQKFEEAAKSQDQGASSLAFKEITKTLLLSQTFVKADPEKDQCYDFAPGNQASSLPCEISFLMKKNCTQCHSATGAAGGLDFTSWKAQANGETNFKHLGRDGIQQAKKVTFEKLLESLSTADEAKLMPLSKFMSPNERAQIFKWVNREASSVPGGQP